MDMEQRHSLLTFYVDEQAYALPLESVERVVRAAEPTPLHGAPRDVDGLIDIQGRVMPMVQLRAIIGGDTRALRLSDRLLVLQTPGPAIALVVDRTGSVVEVKNENVMSTQGMSLCSDSQGIVCRDADGLFQILDLPETLGGVQG
jgi:purine-binding chemotaxis protein CheW